MSSIAKEARAAMKAKAQRLGSSRPTEKVDSSTWTPPELLNADVKTGMRPVSRRAFKKGGKVVGDCNAPRADRKPRKAGGKAEVKEWVDAKINRNVKDANEQREGIKHIGGMKKGGKIKRKGHATDGRVDEIGDLIRSLPDTGNTPAANNAILNARTPTPEMQDVTPAQARRMQQIMGRSAAESAAADRAAAEAEAFKTRGYKKGGRTKKAIGGPKVAADRMMRDAQETSGVSGARMSFQPVGQGKLSPMQAAGVMKKGGAAKKHDDVVEDKALIKKMVKPEAMRKARKAGGGVFTGEGYPHKIPGVVPGGREARATGGKTKGKTNINIVIAAGKHPGQEGMMPPGGMPPKPPGGIPVPVAPPGAGPGAGMGAPMGIPMGIPMPVPSAAGATPPAGGLPLPRKAGGRISKIASSYKDMEAGAAGGEGRLQKSDIAKKHKDAPAFKKGGKVYRSYQDMNAGSASGLGRLEKSEIAAR